MNRIVLICWSTLLLLCFFTLVRAYDHPVIGIVTLPVGTSMRKYSANAIAYFPASYAKYVESGGARVVPIQFNSQSDELQSLLQSLNGVLFTGGDDIPAGSPYYTTCQSILDFSISQAKQGVVFPVWGTCLGFETIASLIATKGAAILTNFDAENISLPLALTSDFRNSQMFCPRPSTNYVVRLLSENVTMNNHEWGVKPADFQNDPALSSMFHVLATSLDKEGNEFISLVEGYNVPIYGSQFHPEKPQFEWFQTEQIDHSPEAIFAMQFFGDFFIRQARQSPNSFANYAMEEKYSLNNFSPTFTALNGSGFDQCYFF